LGSSVRQAHLIREDFFFILFDPFLHAEVTLSVTFLPFQFIDRQLIAEMFKLFGRENESKEMKRTMFANADYGAVMLTELQRFMEMGLLDVELWNT
jgi:hypothetical protein